MNVLKYIFSLCLLAPAVHAKDYKLSQIGLKPAQFRKLNSKQQVEYITRVNEIMYKLEALQGPLTEYVVKGPPFFLRFQTAYADDGGMVPGDMCLYGGWKSIARKAQPPKGSYCPRPEQGVKCTATDESGKQVSDGFTCNVWGLKESVCVKRLPLNANDTEIGLTQRCIMAITGKINDLKDRGGISDEEIKALNEQLTQFKLGKDGSQRSFDEYCKVVTRQSAECGAIQVLINKVAELIPPEQLTEGIVEEVKVEECFMKPDCWSCEMEKIYGERIAPKYLQLVDVMAHRCYAEKGQLLSAEKLEETKRKMILNLGYCGDYNVQKGVQTKQGVVLDSWKRKKYAGPKARESFYHTFGLQLKDADGAFCGDLNNATVMQRDFDRAMRKSRDDKNEKGQDPENIREATGWERCDLQLQVHQGRPILSGVSYDDALLLAKQLGKPAPLSMKGKPINTKQLWDIENPDSSRFYVRPAFAHVRYQVEKGKIKYDESQKVTEDIKPMLALDERLKSCNPVNVKEPAAGGGNP